MLGLLLLLLFLIPEKEELTVDKRYKLMENKNELLLNIMEEVEEQLIKYTSLLLLLQYITFPERLFLLLLISNLTFVKFSLLIISLALS
jgi:hypothetical protein